MVLRKLNTKNKSSKKIIITLVVVVLLAIGAYFIYQHNQTGDTQSSQSKDANSVDYGKASTDQTTAGDQTKNDNLSGNSSDTPPAPTSQPGSDKKVAEVLISAKNKTSQTYQIRASISALMSDGTCTLTLTKGSATVTKTAGVQNQSSTSTCTGFDVPLSELSAGTWQLTLTVDSPSITGTVNTTITV